MLNVYVDWVILGTYSMFDINVLKIILLNITLYMNILYDVVYGASLTVQTDVESTKLNMILYFFV